MKILAFDQSSTASGYCLLNDGDIVESGMITKKGKDRDKRVAEMNTSICAKIDEFKPDLVVIENIQDQNSIATVILLARLQGMILGYCYAHSIRVEILGPSQWRAMLKFKQGKGIKREELKEQASNYVATHFDLITEIDQAEAICIGVAANKIF